METAKPKNLRLFMREFFRESLAPEGSPRTEWKVFRGDSLEQARRLALESARRDSNSMEFSSPSWNSMLRAAESEELREALKTKGPNWNRTRWLQRSVVSKTTRLALGAAGLTSHRVVGDFTRTLAVGSRHYLLEGTGFESNMEVAEHLADRLDALRRGYIPLCDIDGALYVYAQNRQRV